MAPHDGRKMSADPIDAMSWRLSPEEREALESHYLKARRELLAAGFTQAEINRLMPVTAEGGLEWDDRDASSLRAHPEPTDLRQVQTALPDGTRNPHNDLDEEPPLDQ